MQLINIMENLYQNHGFKNRAEYLADMAANYGDEVYALAEVLGESEDFDGLVSTCEDLLG